MGCESLGIKLIDMRHETAAVQAAKSYATMSRGVDVAFVTANRGCFSNGIPGLASAPADRSPILIIISSPPLRDSENKSLQGIIDHVVVNQPLTKFAHRATILKMRRGWSVGRMHPHHALEALLTSLSSDPRIGNPITVLDGGGCAFWAYSLAHILTPRAILKSTGALGFLGNGFGYALGAAIAASGTKVINVQGDGSAGFHFMELDTCARLDLDELVYGHLNPKRPISALSAVTGYAYLSRGLGDRGFKAQRVEACDAAPKVLELGGPACLELIVDSKAIHTVTEMMVGEMEDPDLVVVTSYDNIPRGYYKV